MVAMDDIQISFNVGSINKIEQAFKKINMNFDKLTTSNTKLESRVTRFNERAASGFRETALKSDMVRKAFGRLRTETDLQKRTQFLSKGSFDFGKGKEKTSISFIERFGIQFDKTGTKIQNMEQVLANLGTMSTKEMKQFNESFRLFDTVGKGGGEMRRSKSTITSAGFQDMQNKLKVSDVSAFLKQQKGTEGVGGKLGAKFGATGDISNMASVMNKIPKLPADQLRQFTKEFSVFKKDLYSIKGAPTDIQNVSKGFKNMKENLQITDTSDWIKQNNLVGELGAIVDTSSGKITNLDQVMTNMGNLAPQRMGVVTKSFNDFKQKTDKSREAAGKFKMELLGVMFFGMALGGAMMGLLNPAMEAFGIFDMWGATLLVFFTPLMSILQPLLFFLMDIFMGMPEVLQVVIGAFVALLAIVGTGIFIFGQMALGFDSLMVKFPKAMGKLVGFGKWFSGLFASLGTAVTGLATTLGVSVGVLLAWVLVIIAAIVFLYLAWKNNWGGIREHLAGAIEGVKNILNGLWEFLKGLVNFVIHLFTDWSKLGDDLKQMFGGLYTIFVEGFGRIIAEGIAFVIDLFKQMIDWVDKKSGGLITKFYDMAVRIKNALVNMLPDWLVTLLSGAKKLTIDIFTKLGQMTGLTEMAEGGIVTSPTQALIGEAGPEAVIPLDKLAMMNKSQPMNYAPVYNISAGNLGNEFDKRKLINEINRTNYNDLKQVNVR